MVTILSIDGGGIRGILPAAFLAEFEKRTGRPVCALFDLVAGTSTGGILAAVLTVPDARGAPQYGAEEIAAAYVRYGGEIFKKSPLRTAATLGGLTRPLYSPRALDGLLTDFLGEKRLHETLTEVLITAYDMAGSAPWFFKTSRARYLGTPTEDPLLAQAVRATASAPTYFPPLRLAELCLIDGGVFAANPALCAYAQAKKTFPAEKDFLLISLGTGLQNHRRACAEVEDWGMAGWAVPISGVMLNAASATVDYQLRALLGAGRYVRFQTQLDERVGGMDDASPENIRLLQDCARQAVAENEAELAYLCRLLARREHRTAYRMP